MDWGMRMHTHFVSMVCAAITRSVAAYAGLP